MSFYRQDASRRGTSMRRFSTPVGRPARNYDFSVKAGSPIDLEARTRYPATRRRVEDHVQALKWGHNNSKIGARSIRGRWRGMPIYTLTLEERATCPRSCAHWLTCYGNTMPMALRMRHGAELETALERELSRLNHKHRGRGGFIFRLHVLGDFYSSAYVLRWAEWLAKFRGLFVFGYTAHAPDSTTGKIIGLLNARMPGRWVVRFSNQPIDRLGAITVQSEREAKDRGAIACPAQTGKTDCCGTCGLCWQTDRNIAFLAHA